MHLTAKELRLVSRLQQEESHRWLFTVPGLFAGIFLILIHWNAPWAYLEFTSLSPVEKQAIPHHGAVYLGMWFAGLVMVVFNLKQLFFNRERKLLMKLVSQYQETEQQPSPNP